MREILKISAFPEPRFRYSACVKTGPFYHFAGMIGLKPESGQLVSDGPKEETRQILANLIRGLPEVELGLENLASATVYTTRFDEFSAVNQAWEEVFTDAIDPPARTAIGVSNLPLGASVEIEFRFYKAE